MVIKAAAIAFTIATTAAGAFFGLTRSAGYHSQPVVSPRTLAVAAELTTGPTVTVAMTKQLPITPYAGDMAFTRTGEAITVTEQTSTPALGHVPARTSVYLTIRFGFPPEPTFFKPTFFTCSTPPCTFRVGTTYIVRLAGHTILHAVYPSHAFLGLPPPSMLVVFSKQYTFSHPGVYRFVGRLSIDGVTRQASIRVRVTG